MSKSLKDQLLALGLAQESDVRTRSGTGRKPTAKPQQKSRSVAKSEKREAAASEQQMADSELSLEQAYRLREKHARDELEQDRERKRWEDLRRRQINEEIRIIVEARRVNDPAAQLSRNFIYKGRIRKVNVTARQFKELNGGALGLVYLAGGYHIMQPEYVEQVRKLSAEHVPDLTGGLDEDSQYPVPDDLIW